MPQLPLIVWIELGVIVPLVAALVLAVEFAIVRPSVEEERERTAQR